MKLRHSLIGLLFCVQVSTGQDLHVMSFNIRLNIASDSLNAWPYRKDKISSQVLFHKADVLGVQEALHGQITDLKSALKRYSYIGVGREGGEKGEYSAIYYNNERLTLMGSSTFWLSTTPQVIGSKGWDAALPRIVTWARLRDKKTRKTFFVFNTHFDHMGKVARKESAKLLLQAVDSIAGKSSAIIIGDFNARPNEEPIEVITNKNSALHLIDAKTVSLAPHYGPTGTFNGFGSKETSDQPIDYIFYNRGVMVLVHATISQTWMGRFASDHFAVLARIRLL